MNQRLDKFIRNEVTPIIYTLWGHFTFIQYVLYFYNLKTFLSPNYFTFFIQ